MTLWFDEASGYYYMDEKCSCDACNKEIDSVVNITTQWFKDHGIQNHYCNNCITQRELIGNVTTVIQAVLGQPPQTAEPVIPRKPRLVTSDKMESVFSAADSLGGIEVVDKTKLSGKPLDENVKVGWNDEQIRKSLEDKHKPLTKKEADKVLGL